MEEKDLEEKDLEEKDIEEKDLEEKDLADPQVAVLAMTAGWSQIRRTGRVTPCARSLVKN